MEIFSYCVPTRVVFGRGALGQLHTLPALGKKALLVTSGGKSYKLNGSFDKLTAELDEIKKKLAAIEPETVQEAKKK